MSSEPTHRRRRASIEVVDANVALDLATAQTYSENVFLFVPNLIGYTRVILAGLSLHYMSYHPKYYGQAARALGQTSKFGAVLDMVTDRHYMHMYSSLVTGSRSHKSVQSDVSRILRWYYNNQTTLFLVCAGNEVFFVALYLMKWTHTPLGLGSFSPSLAEMTWAHALAAVSFPIFFIKNFLLNTVQLWKASKILVGVDLAERAKAREEALSRQR
ncbi:hypothetical protein ONZ45_g16355 [Pleurotus djamor]|nr:hypothetical protein ONZ45_g16355 [Pleurotus djamor]